VAAIVSTLLLAAAGALAAAHSGNSRKAPTARIAKVPKGFVGMNLNPPFFDKAVKESAQLATMVSSGVESVRVVFNWAAAQPQENGPISFAGTDQIVGLAAARGMTVLPTVLYTPNWAAAPHPSITLAIPKSNAPYAAYVKALAQRYGPHGSYWSEHPGIRRLPIRAWQIWNEPNFKFDWPDRPFAPGYVALVRAARTAIKSVDPGGKVVLAGMPDFAWQYLSDIYRVPGARSTFDVVSVNPYTLAPKNVIVFLQKVRAVMDKHGDRRKPMIATETGWQSSNGHASDNFCCQTTVSGQTKKVAALLPLLAQNRVKLRLTSFYYYTWVGDEFRNAPSFNFAGLFRLRDGKFVAKPAYQAFRRGALAIERCKVKGPLATSCRKSG
jgi:hypothetical protein